MIIIGALITIFLGTGGIYAMIENTERRKEKHILKIKQIELETLKIKREDKI